MFLITPLMLAKSNLPTGIEVKGANGIIGRGNKYPSKSKGRVKLVR